MLSFVDVYFLRFGRADYGRQKTWVNGELPRVTFSVEVRIPRMGYLVLGRDAPGVQPNGKSSWENVAAAAIAVI